MDILKLNNDSMELVVEQAVKALEEGQVLACPTDTIYGLLADATNKEAVGKVFDIKEREKQNALPVFVRDIEAAEELAVIEKKEFLEKHWPGKVTVVLKSRGVLPSIMGTVETIGLRVPDYLFLKLVLNKFEDPLTGTSANISGTESLSSAKEVISQFKDRKYKPDIMIDAGQLPFSKPSSVVDLTGKEPIIIREGDLQNLW